MEHVVLKFGGSICGQLPDSFFADVVHLQQQEKWRPLIVHGGGPMISSLSDKLGLETQFVNGLRVTTDDMLDVVEMVLSGLVNKQVVRRLLKFGGLGWGLSGIDGASIIAKIKDEQLGFVGEVVDVNPATFQLLHEQGYIPVLSPLGVDAQGQRYNINGDTVAGAVASKFQARLIMISDIPGIYADADRQQLLDKVTRQDVLEMIDQGIISGGMIPKVQAALYALEHGAPEVTIVNGLHEHILQEISEGHAVGTKIVLEEEYSHVVQS
ncbi:acetylglutamate kinase [Bacillus horti]|uniref:Acetylglutamate kinase n=1 Tax=Caldalkalibacillus horti TaxID=77523 RepID=A0ABT9VZZ8_9BACI|nr:acetylglutamate kinase [Bacillus horti]MDQ0166542.1 acetylglutamate kinase [Bacillus horti]